MVVKHTPYVTTISISPVYTTAKKNLFVGNKLFPLEPSIFETNQLVLATPPALFVFSWFYPNYFLSHLNVISIADIGPT